ncbi:MAG: hypothetical protein ACOYBE_05425 [Blautia sp.]|jgi:hypothetical protein
MYTPKGELNDELFALVKDPDFVKELEGLKTPEEGYEVVKKRLPNMSMEEFQTSMGIMYAYLVEQEDGLLDEEDLDAVAGGKSTAKSVSTALGVTGGVAGAAGAIIGVVTASMFTACV